MRSPPSRSASSWAPIRPAWSPAGWPARRSRRIVRCQRLSSPARSGHPWRPSSPPRPRHLHSLPRRVPRRRGRCRGAQFEAPGFAAQGWRPRGEPVRRQGRRPEHAREARAARRSGDDDAWSARGNGSEAAPPPMMAPSAVASNPLRRGRVRSVRKAGRPRRRRATLRSGSRIDEVFTGRAPILAPS